MTKEELLQKKLDIAVKALKETKRRIESFNDDPMNKISFMAYGTLHDCLDVAKKALKEVEVVDMFGTLVSLAKEEV